MPMKRKFKLLRTNYVLITNLRLKKYNKLLNKQVGERAISTDSKASFTIMSFYVCTQKFNWKDYRRRICFKILKI